MSLSDARVARFFRIEGRVQGVGYRDWFLDWALKHGIQGWIRNRKDSSVEALCIGSEEQIQAAEEATRRGPVMARVKSVTVSQAQGIAGETFRILPTV